MKCLHQAFGALCFLMFALSSSGQADKSVSLQGQKEIIEKTLEILNHHYIFPGKIETVEKGILEKFQSGAYKGLADTMDFLKALNADLESLSGDRHLNIFFDPVRVKQIEEQGKADNGGRTYDPRFLQRARYENYMMRKVERMDGNVGYIKFNAFVDTALSKAVMIAAMRFLEHSSALIIDLRHNGGGDADAMRFLLSYFLPDSTLVSRDRSRNPNSFRQKDRLSPVRVTEHFLAADPSVIKFPKEVPVYILVGGRTASAAEAFAYVLQSYKRAAIIGGTTKGEANPGYLFALNKDLYVMVPAFESINPVTGTNWQGKGITPDLPAPDEKAQSLALAKAYDTLARTAADPRLRSMYDWMATGLGAELNPVMIPGHELMKLAGSYADNRQVVFENGKLYYFRGTNAEGRKPLYPISADLFGLEGNLFFRIRFIKNEKGDVLALEGVYDDGTKERSAKQR